MLSVALFAAAIADGASAASPTISSITPPGGRRGSEITVRISGANLIDGPAVFFYDEGVTVKSVEPLKDKNGKVANDRNIEAVLVIAPDCRLGYHELRVRTASGVSPMPLLFSVGALPETPEAEPNNDFDKAQAVSLDTTVTGVVEAEDSDWFVVEAKRGERVTAEVEGIRLGRVQFDSYLAIYDAEKKELVKSDDVVFAWQDAIASIIAPTDGKYFIQLRESTFGGSGACVYRMHVGRFPRPTAVIPAGGRPGETLDVTFLGDIGGPHTQKVTIPAKPEYLSTIFAPDDKATALFPQDDRGIAPSPIVFRVNDLSNVVEAEPNDDLKQATAASAPIAMNGVIQRPGDVDCFQFTGKKGQVYDIRVQARSLRSPLDSVMTVYRLANGSVVGTNDDSGSPDSYFRLNCNDEDYVVQVKDMLSQGGDSYTYRIEVTPVSPVIRLSVAEKVQYVDTVVAVPRGSYGAVMINAARKDFGGEVLLDVANLPKGMKFETAPLSPNDTVVPLLLSAADDAPLASGILDVTARAADDKIPARGRLLQTSVFFRLNQRPVYEYQTYALTSAVVEKAPYKLQIVQPKVPLVRNGQLDLKIKAIREPGFTAPINVRMLYNPAGTAANTTAAIPEGQHETILQLTAGSAAEIRDWKIAVLGSATTGYGNIEVASPFAKLTIGMPYFEFAFKSTSVEQGHELRYVVQASNLVEFPGKAQVELLGLPAEANSEPVTISKDDAEVVFTVKTTKATPAGRHKSIMCKVVVMQNGEPIQHTLGPGEIRVDSPLPPRPGKSKLVGGAQASAADGKK